MKDTLQSYGINTEVILNEITFMKTNRVTNNEQGYDDFSLNLNLGK